jgi:hypothetical protein
MSEVNEGVGIILARMESHPEEFFGMGEMESNKWRWIFKENLREVMTEPEKAALHSGMTKVRRLEITHKAIATIMPEEEEEEKTEYRYAMAVPKPEGKKMIINRAQAEMIKRMNGPAK